MIDSFRNIFAIPDLRKRVLFMFALLGVYRIGCNIPTPGIDPQALLEFMASMQDTFLGFVNTFTGGSLERVAVFALGIMPYITASIVLQLLTVVWPFLEKLSKEGELGRRKITQYTRYLTMGISTIQSITIALWLERMTTPGGASLVVTPGWGFRLMTVLTLTTGCAFVMWLGEQISERGVGNGISLIIFSGIVVALPGAVSNTITSIQSGALSVLKVLVLIAFMVVVVAFIVYMERAQRRIPVQYAKRVVGRKIYGGQNTYLPLRVNTGGVIPVIFASSVVIIPTTVAGMFQNPWIQKIADAAGLGRAAALRALHHRHRLLLLLLRVDHLQPGRHRGEPAQVRRLHSRHPLGQANLGVHRPHPDPPDTGRRRLSGGGLGAARVPAQRLQGAESAVDWPRRWTTSCPTGSPAAWASSSTSVAPRC